MKFNGWNFFNKIQNPVLRKTTIGIVMFVAFILITVMIRFFNFSGAMIGLFFYFGLAGIGVVEFTKNYDFKKWQQLILVLAASLFFIFPIDFYTGLLKINGFNAEEFEANITSFLIKGIYESIIFYPNYIVIVALVLFFSVINKKLRIKDLLKIILVIFLIIFSVLFAKFIFVINFTAYLLFTMLIIGVIFVDTFAYFGGKLFGQKIFQYKLAPMISPNKTVEGAIAGFFAAFIFILIWGYSFGIFERYNFGMNVHIYAFYTASMIPIISIAGDLFFSWIKRNLGIKDFSNLFASHGGLFDRFDSLSFATWSVSLTLIFVPLALSTIPVGVI